MEEQGPPGHGQQGDQRKAEEAVTYIPQLLRPLKLHDLPVAAAAAVPGGNGSSNGEEEPKLSPLPSPPTLSSSCPSLWMPRLMYGTAWKGERTEDLVYKALRAGFRAIDTAAQPQNYDEAAVGRGIRRAVSEGIVKREDLFVRTSWRCRGERALHINLFFTPFSFIYICIITSSHQLRLPAHPHTYVKPYLHSIQPSSLFFVPP